MRQPGGRPCGRRKRPKGRAALALAFFVFLWPAALSGLALALARVLPVALASALWVIAAPLLAPFILVHGSWPGWRWLWLCYPWRTGPSHAWFLRTWLCWPWVCWTWLFRGPVPAASSRAKP